MLVFYLFVFCLFLVCFFCFLFLEYKIFDLISKSLMITKFENMHSSDHCHRKHNFIINISPSKILLFNFSVWNSCCIKHIYTGSETSLNNLRVLLPDHLFFSMSLYLYIVNNGVYKYILCSYVASFLKVKVCVGQISPKSRQAKKTTTTKTTYSPIFKILIPKGVGT